MTSCPAHAGALWQHSMPLPRAESSYRNGKLLPESYFLVCRDFLSHQREHRLSSMLSQPALYGASH